ncbi:MAG: YidC/Oxa1 family membrane protein insertase [Candidatus Dojkabacteria bacterium]
MDIFTVLFYQPIYNLIVVFYRLFSENLGLSIIAISLIAKLIMFPLILRQTRMMGKNMEANDKMKEIKEKYKNDKEMQNKELMKVNSEYLPTLLSGCLPLIVQLILFINIDHVIRDIFSQGAASFNNLAYSFVPGFASNYTFHSSFFGIVDLGKTANEIGIGNLGPVLPYLILIGLTGITQYASMKLSFKGQAQMKEIRKKYGKEEKKKNKNDKKDPNKPDDFGDIVTNTTQQTMILFPALLIFGALGFPIGLSIYWIAQGTFGIIQQLYVNRINGRQLEAEFQKKQTNPNIK